MIKELPLLFNSSIVAILQGQSRSVLGSQDSGSYYEDLRFKRRRNETMNEIKRDTHKFYYIDYKGENKLFMKIGP